MKIKAFNLCFLCALFLLSVVATETLKEGKQYTKESKKNVLVDKLDGGRKPIDIESFDQNKPVGAGNKTREERMMEKKAKLKERKAKLKERKAKQKERIVSQVRKTLAKEQEKIEKKAKQKERLAKLKERIVSQVRKPLAKEEKEQEKIEKKGQRKAQRGEIKQGKKWKGNGSERRPKHY
uniref:Golgin subfamily A member 6-like protein 22 n=1 Tax=Cicer arietinum TaxID=3827 RepID=A0A1S3DXC1_CICAR|nr:golgin subfamily A member 6-like protein 22 [Cicer arietinum]